MPDLTGSWDKFFLVFARITALFFTAPVFASEAINYRLRMILALGVAVILFPIVSPSVPKTPDGMIYFGLAVIGQAAVGMMIGFMMSLVFAAFQLAGEVYSIQAGISFSEVLDPQSQVSSPILGTLKNLLGIIVFLSVDFQMDGLYLPAYLHMIRALSYYFVAIPELFYSLKTTGGFLAFIDQSFGIMFLTALKIALPIIGILFISTVALGLLGRLAPQMNLMNLGIQINIAVGLIVLVVLIPVIVPLMKDSLFVSLDQIGQLYRDWQGMRQ